PISEYRLSVDVLVVLILVRLWQQPKALSRSLTLAAILLATGLLSHYEAALVLAPVGYLLWRIWREGTPLAVLLRAAIVPILVGGGLLASFYLPYVRNPAFYDTFYYLTDYRMGGGRVFNHLAEFFARTTVYSSTYYLLTLILVTLAGLLVLYRRSRPRWLGWLLSVLALAGVAVTCLQPGWWIAGGSDWTWLFVAAALAAGWLMPGSPAERLVWLWFGAPMLLALFFTAIPNTHVYSFFIPWALLVGKLLADGWGWLSSRTGPKASVVGVPVALLLILIFGFYEYWLFVYNRSEVLRTWPAERPPGYWTIYDMPVEVAIFGFPLNNGWKVVGDLYAAGVLQGNYDTNARDVVAEWYTRGQHYCARDDLNYFILANPVEPTLADETAAVRSTVEQEHKLYGTVFVQGNPALSIYQRTEQALTPQRFDLADYASRFDQGISTPDVQRAGPVGELAGAQPVDYRFGDAIQLKGYRLDTPTVNAGEALAVTLYWSATKPLSENYTVFVQLIDLNDLAKAGQSDGQPGCNRYPTTGWLPGDTIADPYRIRIDPHARPGRYSLLIGMYTPDQQLEIFDTAGQSLGQQLELTQVAVQSAPAE
ncbi:MAG TPA: hypothetical protein PKE45_15400, partial [Caldilineaceae bacterium]|nr:hypothetical protein [Caldilineaceae bacterium]